MIERAVASTVNIREVDILRNKLVTGLRTYRASEVSDTPNGNTNATDAAFEAAFLQIRQVGNQVPINNVPLAELCRADNNGIPFELEPMVIDWENTKIICQNASADVSAGNYFLLGVVYQDKDLKKPNC